MTLDPLIRFLFLPAILVVGVFSSFSDWRTSRISNACVLFGILYGVLVYLCGWGMMGKAGGDLEKVASSLFLHFDRFIINWIISCVVAYTLWHRDVWGAGDAKLFIVYALLLPLGAYHRVYFDQYFVSFWLLVLIFVPATFYLFFRATFYFLSEMIRGRSGTFRGLEGLGITIKSARALSVVLLGFFLVYLLCRALSGALGEIRQFGGFGPIVLFMVLIFLFRRLPQYFKKGYWIVVPAIAFFVWFDYFRQGAWSGVVDLLRDFIRTMALLVVMAVVRRATDLHIDRTFQKTAVFGPWMFLGVLLVWWGV
jgi:Flp pilus assembly protein protease CpaA